MSQLRAPSSHRRTIAFMFSRVRSLLALRRPNTTCGARTVLVVDEQAPSGPTEDVPSVVEIHSDGRSQLHGYTVSAAMASSADV